MEKYTQHEIGSGDSIFTVYRFSRKNKVFSNFSKVKTFIDSLMLASPNQAFKIQINFLMRYIRTNGQTDWYTKRNSFNFFPNEANAHSWFGLQEWFNKLLQEEEYSMLSQTVFDLYFTVAPLVGANGGTWSKLPSILQSLKCLINFKNKRDSYCFLYCILYHKTLQDNIEAIDKGYMPKKIRLANMKIKDPQRVSKYNIQDIKQYNILEYPFYPSDHTKLDYFCSINQIFIRIYHLNSEMTSINIIYETRGSENSNIPICNVLLFKYHYSYINKPQKLINFINKLNNNDFQCDLCFETSFISLSALSKHHSLCKSEVGYLALKSPKTLQYSAVKNEIKKRFVIYSDFETLLLDVGKSEGLISDNTQKVKLHQDIGNCILLIDSCAERIIDCDSYIGSNCSNWFINKLVGYSEYLTSSLTKEVNILFHNLKGNIFNIRLRLSFIH